MFIASGKFPEGEEAFYHPAFMGICQTLVTRVSPIYLVDEFSFSFERGSQTHEAASEMT